MRCSAATGTGFARTVVTATVDNVSKLFRIRFGGEMGDAYTLARFLGPGFPRDFGSPFAAPLLTPFFPGGPIGPGVPFGAGVPGFESDMTSPFAWVAGWPDACGDSFASTGVEAFSLASVSAEAGVSSLTGDTLSSPSNRVGETVRVTIRPFLALPVFRAGAIATQRALGGFKVEQYRIGGARQDVTRREFWFVGDNP